MKSHKLGWRHCQKEYEEPPTMIEYITYVVLAVSIVAILYSIRVLQDVNCIY